MDNITQFYTLPQVAQILNVHRMTVRNEIKRGNLKAIKVGKDYRIDAFDLEAYVQHNQFDHRTHGVDTNK